MHAMQWQESRGKESAYQSGLFLRSDDSVRYKLRSLCTVLYCTVLYCTVLYCTVVTPVPLMI